MGCTTFQGGSGFTRGAWFPRSSHKVVHRLSHPPSSRVLSAADHRHRYRITTQIGLFPFPFSNNCKHSCVTTHFFFHCDCTCSCLQTLTERVVPASLTGPQSIRSIYHLPAFVTSPRPAWTLFCVLEDGSLVQIMLHFAHSSLLEIKTTLALN